MIKNLYRFFSFILVGLLITTALLMIFLSLPQVLDYFAEQYLKPIGIKYSHIRGSLFSEIVLSDAEYEEKVREKTRKIHYNILKLVQKKIDISSVFIDSAKVDLSKIQSSKEQDNSSFVPFFISKVKIRDLTLLQKKSSIKMDVSALDIRYDDTVSIKKIDLLLLADSYGKAKIEATLKSNTLRGFVKIFPNRRYLDSLDSYTYPVKFDFQADEKRISAVAKLKNIKLKNIKDLLAKDINLNLNYKVGSDKVEFDAKYKLNQSRTKTEVKQSGFVTLKGKFDSNIWLKFIKKPSRLPFVGANAHLQGDSKNLTLHVEAGLYKLDVRGDYKKFEIKGSALGVDIGLKNRFDIDTHSFLHLSPLYMDGNISIKNLKNRYETIFKLDKNRLNLSAKILQDNRYYFVDAEAKGISYTKDIEVKNLKLILSSLGYGKVKIKGALKSNLLSAKVELYPDRKYLKPFEKYPYPLVCNLKSSLKDMNLTSKIDRVGINGFDIQDIDLTLHHSFGAKHISLNSVYRLKKDNYLIQAIQDANVTTDGHFTSLIDSKILHSSEKLPFERINTSLKGDSKNLTLHVEAGLYRFDIGGDYKKFQIKGSANGVTLGFIDNFPDIFKRDKIDMKIDSTLDISPLKLSGNMFLKSVAGKLDANYDINSQKKLIRMVFYPNTKYKIWKDYRIDGVSPAKITIYSDKNSRVLNVDAKMLNITLFRKKEILGGWGNLARGYFDLNGKIDKKSGISLNVNANLSSLKSFLESITAVKFDKDFYVDAKVNLKSRLNITKDIVFKSKITMPWYEVVLDDKNRYKGKNLWIKSTLVNTQAAISGYSFYVSGYHIYSNRTSKLSLKKSGQIEFKKFWIFDNLLLIGSIDPIKKEGKIHLQGKKFNYVGKEGNITANADINADIKANGEQNIQGKVTLLEGTIKFVPKKEYDLSDSDIIIIQNIHENRRLKRNVDIQIVSKKPILYKTDEVELKFVPDFVLFQEAGSSLGYLGMVTIKDGEIKKSGKEFKLAKSEIYLRGANPLNPYLNINIFYYTPEQIKIKVFITNTLSSPLMILASNPPMSQNDIMSYILFGKPSSTLFADNKNAQTSISLNSILYGAGLKQMFQKTTSIKIDTLNILSSKDKRFGYEIGASINDKVRVIYKNDEISSIIIQYSLSKSIRIDVDVKESGEGVKVLYAKDF